MLFWEEKTKKYETSFFEEYQNYLNNIYYQNSPKKLSEKCIESYPFFKEDNIIRFLLEYKGYKNTTFKYKLGLFRRIIRVMMKNPT